MTEIAFLAQEYQSDGQIETIPYAFIGSSETGWSIHRDGRLLLRLGPGYVAVRNRHCGVCSTDLARHRLPFPLPQIIGHEVLAEYRGQAVAVEINASHRARREHVEDCAWCAAGLERHCPARLTLGIDRLPGGFSPWLLAPQGGLHVLPATLNGREATLIEPFAAALRAVEVSRPRDGDSVAVLGPRRRGMLLLVALAAERRRRDQDYTITALVRRNELAELALGLGADQARIVDGMADETFDTVYDTTGNPEGLATALRLARRCVHLKSTSGGTAFGMRHLSEFVIDELNLSPLPWPNDERPMAACLPALGEAPRILALPSIPATVMAGLRRLWPLCDYRQETIAQATEGCLREGLRGRYDAVVVADLDEADAVIRPLDGRAISLLRPGGCILLGDTAADSPLARAIVERGLVVQGSRCGDFVEAIAILGQEAGLIERLGKTLISHVYPLADLREALARAGTREAVKVVVDCAE